ncbi:MAG TPA: tetratricopeptide repeat protein [Micromonosporaceae bacterium]
MRQRHSDPVEFAAAAAALGEEFQAIGEHAAAEDVLRRAVAVFERAGEPGDARLAAALSALGAACAARGHLDEAERLFRRALRITGTTQEER